MLSHLLKAGTRALATAIVVAGLLIYAGGGLDSPHATPLVGVSIAGFFIFWIMFALVFAKRAPANDTKVDTGSTDGGGHFRQRGHRREYDESGHDDEGGSDGGGSADGGGGD